MRFLLTCIPGLGHFHPLVNLARALIDAGHTVAFVTAPVFARTVRDAGFECIPGGMDWDERRLLETVPELRTVARSYRGEWMMNHIFLDRSPRRMVPDLLEIIRSWRPDAIVAGSFEYGGPLAAELAGLPYATGSYTIRWNRWILRHALGRQIARLRREFGLPSDPDMSAFGRYLDLCFAPPSWTFESALLRPGLTKVVANRVVSRDLPLRQRLWGLKALLLQRVFARSLKARPEDGAVAATMHFIGEPAAAEAAVPPWLQDMPRQPTVFASLGTVLGAENPEIYDKILAALRDQPVNLVLTLGGKGDPQRFGQQPSNVRIFGNFTQPELRQLLPRVDLCLNHAGYGSIMDSLLHGIPLVLLPLVSDAPMNNQMCLASGVAPELPGEVWGISPKGLPVIQPEKLTPAIISDAVIITLRERQYREAARKLQRELTDRADLPTAVRLLEEMAAASRPAGAATPLPAR